MAARNSTGARRATRSARKSASGESKFKFKSDDELNAMNASDFADYTLEALRHTPAVFPQGDVPSFEQHFEGVYSRRARRAALAYLGLTGNDLVDKVDHDRHFAVLAAGAMTAIEEYEKYLREVADLMQTAALRLGTALCYREDMDVVLAEGKRSLRDDDGSREAANG